MHNLFYPDEINTKDLQCDRRASPQRVPVTYKEGFPGKRRF